MPTIMHTRNFKIVRQLTDNVTHGHHIFVNKEQSGNSMLPKVPRTRTFSVHLSPQAGRP